MAKKSQKNQIKNTAHEHDYISGALIKLIKFTRANKKAVTFSVCAVLVIAAGEIIYCTKTASLKEKSWKDVFMAQQFGTIESLSKAAEDYKGTDAAQYATYLMAEKYFNDLEYTKAAETYALVKEGKNADMAAVAQISEAVAWQSAQDYEKAIITAKDFIQKNPQHYAVAQAYLTHALSLELSGKKDEAVIVYTQIPELFEGTYFSTFAANKLKKLKK